MVKIDRLPSGSWRARINIGGGKYKTFTGADKKDVQLRAAEFEAGLISNNSLAPKSQSLGEVIDKYIESRKEVLSPSTRRGYLAMRRSMLPGLMEEDVNSLTSEKVQVAINEEVGRKSPKYIENELGLITASLKASFPKIRHDVKTPPRVKSEIEVPTEEEMKKVFQKAKFTEIEIPIILAACCGLRRSEILGLKWENINLESGTAEIKEAIVLDENNDEIQKGTKSYAGTRTIRLFPFVTEALQRAPHDDEYVVTLKGHQIYNRFKKITRDCNLPDYRFHDLRHYLVSVMLSLNVPKNYIIDYVGHETENMIDKVYGHIMKSKKTSVEDQMQNYFESVMKSVT